jgi:hypothetical protein
MSVQDESTTIAYASDGASVNFAVPFYFKTTADLVVTFRDSTGAIVTKLLTTDYAVSGTLDPKLNTYASGGTVTFNVAPATGGQVRISRRTPRVQAAVYVNGDPFPPIAHEVSQDTAQLVIQEARGFLFIADGPPTAGTFSNGDTVQNSNPVKGGTMGWVYINGLWYEFGAIAETAAG